MMQDEVRGQLNRVDKVRNEIVHKGLDAVWIGTQDAGSLLVSAVIACHLLRYLYQIDTG
jgi:hypothetical protein